MREYADLVWTFIKIGSVTFGGGYAMLPILQRELAEKRGWVSLDELADYFAIGQCTPGIIAVNVSTFIGYKRKGIPGAVAATLGFTLPSLVIITLIAFSLERFSEYPPVRHAFAGIRVAVGALILDAVIKLYKGAVKDRAGVAICAAAFLLSVLLKASPVLIVLSAGLAGFLLYRPRPPKPSAVRADDPREVSR
jgi:chromate transporter